MTPTQSDLAAYWAAPSRHGFERPCFTVQITESTRKGAFFRLHNQYVRAWTAEEAKGAAIRSLRMFPQIGGRKLGHLRVVSVTYSEPVTWN